MRKNLRAIMGLVAMGTAAVAVASCSGKSSSTATAPAAPTGLTGTQMAGGVQLSWSDNSDNEDMFMIMRGGSAAMAQIATVDFNTTQYMDMTLTSGQHYSYVIKAMNAVGTSTSNTYSITAF